MWTNLRTGEFKEKIGIEDFGFYGYYSKLWKIQASHDGLTISRENASRHQFIFLLKKITDLIKEEEVLSRM